MGGETAAQKKEAFIGLRRSPTLSGGSDIDRNDRDRALALEPHRQTRKFVRIDDWSMITQLLGGGAIYDPRMLRQ